MTRGREVELPFVSKAPFANYDLVVYLGGGLFSVLILWRYIGWPLGIFDFTSLTSSEPHSWVQDVIYLLIIGVCAYVLGHMISYQSSYFIEGFIEKTLGKFSQIVEVTTVDRRQRAAAIRGQIKSNIANKLLTSIKIPLTGLFLPRFLPTIAHLPVLPWYGFVCLTGMFDFADTRLPKRMIGCAKGRMESTFRDCDFHESRQWFRWIEYYTAYNRPVSAASMYNYLVISGLMRSLAYIFLVAIWLEIAHFAWRMLSGEALISHGPGGMLGWALYFFVLYVAYVTTVTSYCKFFRRYVEEAIMGFLLEESAGQSR